MAMTETRPTYQAGQQPTYRVTVSWQTTHPDGRITIDDDEMLVEAAAADQAAVICLAQLERHRPKRATITNLVLQVSLEL